MRLAPFAIAALLPGLAFSTTLPAPTAEYRAEASVSVSVSRVVFLESGADASGSIETVTWADIEDSGGDPSGVDRELSSNLGELVFGEGPVALPVPSNPFRFALSTSGAALPIGPNFEVESGYGAGFWPAFVYPCEEVSCEGAVIAIDFSYDVRSSEDVIISDPATSSARANGSATSKFYVGQYDDSFADEILELRVDEGSGIFSMLLSPGEGIGVYMDATVFGEAIYTAPAPIPLPASGVVLAGGLALLGGIAITRRPKDGRVHEGDAT